MREVASSVLLYETRRKVNDAFRGKINGRLKHHLYRKLGSLNRRHDIYFEREREREEREIRDDTQRNKGIEKGNYYKNPSYIFGKQNHHLQ